METEKYQTPILQSKNVPGRLAKVHEASIGLATVTQGLQRKKDLSTDSKSKHRKPNLKAWLQTLFQKRNPNISAKDIADLIQRMVIPVSQTSMTQNPRIGEMEEKMLGKDEWMHFSDNPLWPWCFGNAAVESKGDPPIRRIVKGTGHLGKIDPIHGLLDALYCFDWSEGRIEN